MRDKSSWKVVHGQQEWITAIECVSTAGVAIPQLIIFKVKHTNAGWIPEQAPVYWRFSTSNSGWTLDSHGYEWLTTVFEPSTRPEDPHLRRLLIADGHSSHVTAQVITFCTGHTIDLRTVGQEYEHELQPLNVGVFTPLERALARKTDDVARLDSGRTPRVE
jgi:hypothetical protein